MKRLTYRDNEGRAQWAPELLEDNTGMAGSVIRSFVADVEDILGGRSRSESVKRCSISGKAETISDYGKFKIPPPAGTKEKERPSYMDLYQRLAAIEDILGDKYDLDRLCELAQADREERSKQMKRDEILEAARGCVCGEREQDYGSPEDSFALIAKLWEDYLQSHCVWDNGCVDINSKDVAVMMILLKVARVAGGSKSDDNWIDIAGYAACGGEIMSGGDSNACIGD